MLHKKQTAVIVTKIHTIAKCMLHAIEDIFYLLEPPYVHILIGYTSSILCARQSHHRLFDHRSVSSPRSLAFIVC